MRRQLGVGRGLVHAVEGKTARARDVERQQAARYGAVLQEMEHFYSTYILDVRLVLYPSSLMF